MAKRKKVRDNPVELPISEVYKVLDTDLARDNVEKNLSQTDRRDL